MNEMKADYLSIYISPVQAAKLALRLYKIEGDILSLPGEFDFNFRIKKNNQSFILKISRPDIDSDYIEFQQELLNYISKSELNIQSPEVIPDIKGNYTSKVTDESGNTRYVRLLSWIKGRLWSNVNPQKKELLYSLGEQTGLLTKALQDFDHTFAHRPFEWDIAQSEWTFNHVHLFNDSQQKIIKHFRQRFKEIQGQYQSLRKSIVHHDANDNNVIVTDDLIQPKVKAIVDYGDAVYTQIINDLAIVIAYAVMNKQDVISASLPVINGYHTNFPLQNAELECLYILVAMRLVITVTKSAINKKKEPENKYLTISEKAAWKVLEKWLQIDEHLAYYSFRGACGLIPQPKEKVFTTWIKKQKIILNQLFPDLDFSSVHRVDMSVSSTWLGHESEYNDIEQLANKIDYLQKQNPDTLLAGGYLETRPIYCTDAFKKEGNNGPEYRTVHLGIDFWVAEKTAFHSLFDGTVFSTFNNDKDGDYGPTLILEHKTEEGLVFFTLYGHLNKRSLNLFKTGQTVKKGMLLGYVGSSLENGNWVPHLHFQLMLDRLGNHHDFPGVAFPEELLTWKSICPDPNLLFNESNLELSITAEDNEIIAYRKKHLGKSLSLSYNLPLNMVRGSGTFLIDVSGRKYLDTVNNVAHVGHENPQVIKAAQEQMAVLNTNTRYLHENINDFAKELLDTFPKKLSVVHFVNSGSEANELALRMIRTYTDQKDMIVLEIGYHGNTTSCIDISSYKFDGKGGKGPPEHTHVVPIPDAYRGLYQGTNTGAQYANHVQEKIEFIRSKGRNVAGFICESIMSCGGQIELPKDFLRITFEMIRKAGGLCIADEVQVGCGRVGSKFWGFQLHDVFPDIVTIGKPIGNGHPLAAVICTQEVTDAFANGMEYFNTFGGNPVSCAIGHTVLKLIKEEKLQENALKVGNYLKSGLHELQMDFPIIGDVRGQGLFLGFELADENKNPLTNKASYLINRMKELGILMSTDGKDNNVLKIKPPLVFSKENADELLFRLRTVFSEDFMRL
jgi:4-aminobutyrate aminotransferase-like enzyme/Ser/Thr protein kinase RdoA (MazF antagonist)